MIVAGSKPLSEIIQHVEGAKKVLIVGCGECVTVCMAGGEKEVELLCTALKIWRKKNRQQGEFVTQTILRQCEPEYVEELAKNVEDVDLILSMACGVGVQFLAERYKDKWVVPALNTQFAGGALETGYWAERCGLCGECVLDKTGGICPVARCSKSLLNGPCGGSEEGKCEVSKETDCAWQLIYDRLKAHGRLFLLYDIQPPKDWSKSRDGGPRRLVREDVRI